MTNKCLIIRCLSLCFWIVAGCSKSPPAESSAAAAIPNSPSTDSGTGYVQAVHETGEVPVICYHPIEKDPQSAWSISVDNFEEQLRYFAENKYNTLTLNDIKEWQDGRKPLVSKSILLTFDDWHPSHYDIAIPLLEKYGQTATFFIIGRSLADTAEVEKLKDVIARGFSVGSHSSNHKPLTSMSDDQSRLEAVQSKKDLENALKITVDYFCYPFGYFNEDTIVLLEEAGYIGGFTTVPGLNRIDTSPFKIRRILLERHMTIDSVLRLMNKDVPHYLGIYDHLGNAYIDHGLLEPARVILEELNQLDADNQVTKKLTARLAKVENAGRTRE